MALITLQVCFFSLLASNRNVISISLENNSTLSIGCSLLPKRKRKYYISEIKSVAFTQAELVADATGNFGEIESLFKPVSLSQDLHTGYTGGTG